MVALMALPWRAIDLCLAHPGGHEHHHAPGELSPCQARKLATGVHYWPPMDCEDLLLQVDDFSVPDPLQVPSVSPSGGMALPPTPLQLGQVGQQPLRSGVATFHRGLDPPGGLHPLRGPPAV
jgi:hypothetical protein